MKTSTEIGSISKIVGERKAVEYVAKAGFDAWDLSMFSMVRYDWERNAVIPFNDHPLAGENAIAFVKELRRIGEDNGIRCNQSHAPFPTRCKAIRDTYKKALELTAVAGGEICVIHPDNDLSAQANAEMYAELLPFAKDCGVKIAAENMWNWDDSKGHAVAAACSSHDDFLKHILAVNDENFVACLDIGHAEMRGLGTSAPLMIRTLGSHLQALHIHDNDRLHDSHQIPFSMDIDFKAIVDALKDIGYGGYFTLEADRYLSSANYDESNAFQGVRELYSAVRRLKEDFES